MNKHFELIAEYCTIIAIVGENAILYIDEAEMRAEINGALFSCESIGDFYDLINMIGDDIFQE